MLALRKYVAGSAKKMTYDKLSQEARNLGYRDKLRLAQLLIQLARKEVDEQNSERRPVAATGKADTSDLTAYVAERIKKLRPAKKAALLNSVSAMFQFQGGLSEQDRDKIVEELQKGRHIKLEADNRVSYPE